MFVIGVLLFDAFLPPPNCTYAEVVSFLFVDVVSKSERIFENFLLYSAQKRILEKKMGASWRGISHLNGLVLSIILFAIERLPLPSLFLFKSPGVFYIRFRTVGQSPDPPRFKARRRAETGSLASQRDVFCARGARRDTPWHAVRAHGKSVILKKRRAPAHRSVTQNFDPCYVLWDSNGNVS